MDNDLKNRIIAACEELSGVSFEQGVRDSRKGEFAIFRQIFYWCSKKENRTPLYMAARILRPQNPQNHATVIYGERRISELLSTDANLNERFRDCFERNGLLRCVQAAHELHPERKKKSEPSSKVLLSQAQATWEHRYGDLSHAETMTGTMFLNLFREVLIRHYSK